MSRPLPLFLLFSLTFSTTLSNEKPVIPSHPLARAYDDVLPPDIFSGILRETQIVLKDEDDGQESSEYETTYWFPLEDSPRNNIELAITQLYELANASIFYETSTTRKIIGAEYWSQKRGGNDSMQFHFDKDEAFAAKNKRYKFPLLATVTYLTDVGAPTLIFNQTVEYPPPRLIEGEGQILSYPRKNRHIIFRGDLRHGVVGQMSFDDPGSTRRMLAVNWWTEKPLEPNCMVISDELAHANKLISDLSKVDRSARGRRLNVKLEKIVIDRDKPSTFDSYSSEDGTVSLQMPKITSISKRFYAISFGKVEVNSEFNKNYLRYGGFLVMFILIFKDIIVATDKPDDVEKKRKKTR